MCDFVCKGQGSGVLSHLDGGDGLACGTDSLGQFLLGELPRLAELADLRFHRGSPFLDPHASMEIKC